MSLPLFQEPLYGSVSLPALPELDGGGQGTAVRHRWPTSCWYPVVLPESIFLWSSISYHHESIHWDHNEHSLWVEQGWLQLVSLHRNIRTDQLPLDDSDSLQPGLNGWCDETCKNKTYTCKNKTYTCKNKINILKVEICTCKVKITTWVVKILHLWIEAYSCKFVINTRKYC